MEVWTTWHKFCIDGTRCYTTSNLHQALFPQVLKSQIYPTVILWYAVQRYKSLNNILKKGSFPKYLPKYSTGKL